MSSITNLNQTNSEELKQLLVIHGIIIKKPAADHFNVICPFCEKPEAFIYFNKGTRNIECSRKNNCDKKIELWQHIANKQGLNANDNFEMLKYINQTLGREFKDFKHEQNSNYNSGKAFIHRVVEINNTPPVKTTEELEQEANDMAKKQKFFKDCHEIFTDTLNNQGDSKVDFSLRYLNNDRGYSTEQIKSFKLGFFPDKNNLINLLQDKKYSYSTLEAEELIAKYFDGIVKNNNYQKSEDGNGRITFIWHDMKGEVTGFTVRKPTTDNTFKPKYLNNNGLSKTDHLFNLPNPEEGNSKDLIIVEGLLDALSGTYFASRQEETKNYHFVATGGSQITNNQIACLKSKGYSKVILLPDKDKAGNKGFENSSIKLTEQDITPYIASIPDDYEVKDIDELIRKYQDSINLKTLLETAIKQTIVPKNDNTLKQDKKMIAKNNDVQKLIPEIQELLDKIKEDQKLSIESKEPLDIFKYTKAIRSLRTSLVGQNIGLNKKYNPNFIALNSVYSDIREFNRLLLSDDAEDKPYTSGQFFEDISQSLDGLKTGFLALDKHVSIQPSSLVFIAGRPSHGKTTMMLNLLKNMIEANEDKAFLFYSYEETKSDILLKIILSITNNQNLNQELIMSGDDGVNLRQRALNQFKKYPLCIKKENGKLSAINSTLEKAYNKVNNWIVEGRLQIMTSKSSAESLSFAIIERCMACSKKEGDKQKPIAAVFIDYVQKLNTEEERVNRQQEIQRICQTLLSTALDKRVAASIILGAQVNRGVISLDTLNLDNMREAGDIEQDANLVLGIWNEQAGLMDMLIAKLTSFENTLKEDEARYHTHHKKLKEVEKTECAESIKHIKDMITALQNPPPNTPNTLKIKVLKNRNGQNNGVFELNGYLDRYLIEDTLDTKVKLVEASKNNN